MKIEDQVCSLELAARLKGLGVRQESYFIWQSTQGVGVGVVDWRVIPAFQDGISESYEDISAFTVGELGEMIGDYAYTRKIDKIWVSFLHRKHFDDKYAGPAEITEADARAKMLIYLIENKLAAV
jgi:hypothetical protein